MKKYIKPKCNPICLDMEALIAVSGEDDPVNSPGGNGDNIGGDNTEALSRRRSIWDDPFVF